MKDLASLTRAALVLVLATAAARDESLAPETARRLKDATVYVKVAIGPLALSGSGFVIQTEGNSALIATNRHVVTKPRVAGPLGFIPGLRGRDRIALMRIQQILNANEPVISVVFNSGEPTEQVVKAEVLCQVDEPDMAVLKVSSLRSVPKPIEFRQTIQPVETMPVLILGYPFGESLSTTKSNPSITIGRGSVSSMHKDKTGKVVKIQIDGALNPGNSGGPVVDGRGNLVGIAVQTIQGSNIGLTIPAGELTTMLKGSLGKPAITVTAGVNGAAPKYNIAVPVIDPLKKLASGSVRFVLKSIPADPTKAGQPQLDSEAGSRKLDLPLRAAVARVELPLDAKASRPISQVTVQASFVTKEGKTVYLEPQVIPVPKPVQVSTTSDGKGGTTTTITQTQENGNGGQTSRRQVTITRRSSSGNQLSPPGAGKKGTYKIGDKVLVDWAGRTETAEVVGFAATGWIKVKFPRDGIELTPTLPPNQIKPAGDLEKKVVTKASGNLRTWSSKGNKFTIKARFIALKDDAVTLEKENGQTVTVPLDKLSEIDQRLVRQLAEESEDDPFASKPEKK